MKKKILFLINTLRDGGAEKILVDIVNNLDADKYEIEVKLIYKKGVYLDKINSNVKLSFITGKPGTFRSRIVARLLPRLSSKWLHRIFIRHKYDTEIAFLEGYATKIVAGAPKNTKKLAWVHCDLTKTEWINGVFKTEKGYIDCYNKIDNVISVSQAVQDAFIKRFGMITRLSVIYNPVRVDIIRERARELIEVKPRDNYITLVAIGRMTIPKNFQRLLKSVKRLTDQKYPIELWLLGDGEERSSLEEYVKDNSLSNNVLFIGFVKNPYPYIKQANLFVCSSIYEGFSTAVTESLVIGTPVITTDVAGMREMLGDSEYGLIVPNDDKSFEQGLKTLLDNPSRLLHYRQMAQKRGDDFDFWESIKKIESIL